MDDLILGLLFLLFLGAIVGVGWYLGKRADQEADREVEEQRKKRRELSMAYLRNHAGNPLGLELFLIDSGMGHAKEVKREVELALDQYHAENPFVPEPAHEPVTKKPPGQN
jgi:lipopolysaccharide biosynthesis regulator YciM